jgi:hypothetical protein
MSKDPRADVVKKALTDPAFKAELLKNPAAAVEKAAGVKLPSGVTVKVLEDTASTVHLVLPGWIPAGKNELSEKDLGAVAGGYMPPDFQPPTKNIKCVDSTRHQGCWPF